MATSTDSYACVLPERQVTRRCCKAIQQRLSVTDRVDALRHEFEEVAASSKKCTSDQCEATQIEYTAHVLDGLRSSCSEGLTKSASSLLNLIFWRCSRDCWNAEYVKEKRKVLNRAVYLLIEASVSASKKRGIQRNTLAALANLSTWPSLGAAFISHNGCSVIENIFNKPESEVVAADYEWYEYALCLTINLSCKNGIMFLKGYKGGGSQIVTSVMHAINYFSTRSKISKLGLQALINLSKLKADMKRLILESCLLNGIMQAHSEEQEVLENCIKIVANCLFWEEDALQECLPTNELQQVIKDTGLLQLIKQASWEFDLNLVITHWGLRISSLYNQDLYEGED